MHATLYFLSTICFLAASSESTRLMTMSSKYLGKSPVFVAGGSNGVGLEVVKQLSSMGTPVHVLARREESRTELEKFTGVTVMVGDALDEAAIQKCMTGCVAAITTLGGKQGEGKERVDYMGNSNVIEQAGILGVERVILVTSVGCGNTKSAVSHQVYSLFESMIVEKNKAERDLQTYTNMDWTIIRPGGLKSAKSTGKGILTGDAMASGVINREDVAALVVRALGSNTCTRMELTAIDPSQPSDYNYEKNMIAHKF